jgi:hypothetical protein
MSAGCRRRARLLFATLVALATASTAGAADALAILPGFWNKSLTMEIAGRPAMAPMSIDVCYTPELLAYTNFTQLFDDAHCTLTRKILTATLVDIEFECAHMRGESRTEVVDEKEVRVTGVVHTTLDNGASQTSRSAEVWTFLGPDCPSE